MFGGQTLINLSSTGLPIPPTAAAAIEGISSIQIKLLIHVMDFIVSFYRIISNYVTTSYVLLNLRPTWEVLGGYLVRSGYVRIGYHDQPCPREKNHVFYFVLGQA